MPKYIIALIRCQRNINGSDDDRIMIEGDTNDKTMFSVKHTIPSEYSHKNKTHKTTQLMNNEALHLYLHGLFTLLRNDESPYELIQFDVVGMPTTVAKPHNLDYVASAVINYINTVTALGIDYVPPKYEYVVE